MHIEINKQNQLGLSHYAASTGRNESELANDVIAGYLAWQESEKRLIEERIRRIDDGEPTLSHEAFWAHFER